MLHIWSRPSSPKLIGVAVASPIAVALQQKRPADLASLTLCNPAPGVDPSRAGALNDRADQAERGLHVVSLQQRGRRSNAVRAYLIKYGTAQPVRLHDAPIKDVSGIGMINGIGNQL